MGLIDQGAWSERLRAFAAERDWERYHTPKNLVMAMSVEMAELLEHFQWLTPEESDRLLDDSAKRQAVEEEMADVLLYLLRLADLTGVDLDAAMQAKIVRNAQKYPAIPDK
jgi:NTP pyrophosphatase (non-canonical NTP hydrolase)